MPTDDEERAWLARIEKMFPTIEAWFKRTGQLPPIPGPGYRKLRRGRVRCCRCGPFSQRGVAAVRAAVHSTVNEREAAGQRAKEATLTQAGADADSA